MARPKLRKADLKVSDAEWIDYTDDESEISEEPTTSDDEFIDDGEISETSDDEFIGEDDDWEVEPIVLNVTVTTRGSLRRRH